MLPNPEHTTPPAFIEAGNDLQQIAELVNGLEDAMALFGLSCLMIGALSVRIAMMFVDENTITKGLLFIVLIVFVVIGSL